MAKISANSQKISLSLNNRFFTPGLSLLASAHNFRHNTGNQLVSGHILILIKVVDSKVSDKLARNKDPVDGFVMITSKGSGSPERMLKGCKGSALISVLRYAVPFCGLSTVCLHFLQPLLF